MLFRSDWAFSVGKRLDDGRGVLFSCQIPCRRSVSIVVDTWRSVDRSRHPRPRRASTHEIWKSRPCDEGDTSCARTSRLKRSLLVVGSWMLLASCSGSTSSNATTAPSAAVSEAPSTSAAPATTDAPPPSVSAAAASRSLLPTVNGARDYLKDAPGWLGTTDPNGIGVYVNKWDQGHVDVGNGNDNGVWVHDDIRTTALALKWNGQAVVILTADAYMIFAVDGDEVERRARALLADDPEFADAKVIISATQIGRAHV